jgi:hypothetical protein
MPWNVYRNVYRVTRRSRCSGSAARPLSKIGFTGGTNIQGGHMG